MNNDLSKTDLYAAVKTLVDLDEGPNHLHLTQHKLFTLFSVAFQYLLFRSTKFPGSYIIRIEDSQLADKLARKSKDLSTRRFVQSLLLPRKIKYQKSTFFLDFFHLGSWNMTNEIPKEKLRGAIIVKNTSSKPMNEVMVDEEGEETVPDLPENYYITSLLELVPKTITIAFEQDFDGVHPVEFEFIQKDSQKTVSGVTLGKDMDWDKFE